MHRNALRLHRDMTFVSRVSPVGDGETKGTYKYVSDGAITLVWTELSTSNKYYTTKINKKLDGVHFVNNREIQGSRGTFNLEK